MPVPPSGVFRFLPVFTLQLLLGFLLFIPLIIHDRRSIGQVHPATKLGLAMMALWEVFPLSVFWLGLPWAGVAAHLPGVGA